MKKILLSIAIVLTCSTLFAQHSLEKIWESDSTTLKSPESVLYDSKSNILYVSSIGTGAVVRISTDGKVIKSDWVTGLKSNMGSALFNGLFYTTEPSGLVVIDVEKAAVVKHIPIEGALLLNDVAVDAKGIVYVSDTRSGKVYRIEDEKASVFTDNIPGANGLLTVKTDLYIVGAATIYKVNSKKEVTKVAEGFENGMDGIVMLADNEFLASNYRGMLYHVKTDGSKQVLLDTRALRIGANDISYNNQTKTLYVPSFFTNRIIAYQYK
jgi:sugar lactone lactonase YvrE